VLDANVVSLRLFPGITDATVRAFLSGPIKGVILETFGTGNAPDNRPKIIEAIAEAIRNGVIIVNITQCIKGSVSDIYSTGQALISAGVVSGRDMTAECALTKLSYLLSFPGHDSREIGRLMKESLRGELTEPLLPRDHSVGSRSWLCSLFHSTILCAAQGHRDAVDKTLRPLILHQAASINDLDTFRELASYNTHIDMVDYSEQTCLHVAVSCGKIEAVEWLLRHGANIHLRDCHGRTAVQYNDYMLRSYFLAIDGVGSLENQERYMLAANHQSLTQDGCNGSCQFEAYR